MLYVNGNILFVSEWHNFLQIKNACEQTQTDFPSPEPLIQEVVGSFKSYQKREEEECHRLASFHGNGANLLKHYYQYFESIMFLPYENSHRRFRYLFIFKQLEGMEGLIDQFHSIVKDFRLKRHDLLAYHNNKFDRDYVEFNVKISDLECSLQARLSSMWHLIRPFPFSVLA